MAGNSVFTAEPRLHQSSSRSRIASDASQRRRQRPHNSGATSQCLSAAIASRAPRVPRPAGTTRQKISGNLGPVTAIGAAMDNSPKRAEMNKELRRARRALLAVGIIMFAMDMIFIHGVYRDRLLAEDRNIITAISAGLLCVFIGLWYFTPRHPRLCLGLGFVAFWGIQIYNMVED